MNTKLLLEALKDEPLYSKMCETYLENYADKTIDNDSLEKFIERISKSTKDCINISQMANRRIGIIY